MEARTAVLDALLELVAAVDAVLAGELAVVVPWVELTDVLLLFAVFAVFCVLALFAEEFAEVAEVLALLVEFDEVLAGVVRVDAVDEEFAEV